MNWTKILADHDLETPGYAEACKKTIAKTARKKRLAQLEREAKTRHRGRGRNAKKQ